MKNGYKIIDGHVHTFSSEIAANKIIETFNTMYSIAFENTGNGTIINLLENMEESGVDYTVLANFAPPKIIHANNTWTINMSKQFKQLIPLVSFHPEMKGSLRTHLEGYIIEGAKGIKLHPMAQGFVPVNKRFEELYDMCNEIMLPLVFHCGRVSNARLNENSDIEMILPIIEKYTKIPIVLTHMADGNVEDVLRIAKDYKNVYFDTSIVITGYPQIKIHNEPSWLDDDEVIDVINTIGADRVIFGSDYPWGSPKHDVDRIVAMKLEDSKKKLILFENSKRILKLDKI